MTNESTLEGQVDRQVGYTEAALFLLKHIESPCVEPTTGQNIRGFYIKEAKRILPKIENPHIRSIVEDAINRYS